MNRPSSLSTTSAAGAAAAARTPSGKFADLAAAGELTVQELASFQAAVTERFGHQADERREDALRAVLSVRMRGLRLRSYTAYEALLAGGNGAGGNSVGGNGVGGNSVGGNGEAAAEWAMLGSLLTVPETYFYRMPEHFDALVEEALPRLLEARRQAADADRSLRLLSAGCASGEEAYTLRMVLSERLPEWTGPVTIDGEDLSEVALARAREGTYTEWSLRATDPAQRRRWFQTVGKQFRLQAEARAGVTFRQENLLAGVPGSARYDVIFCRNVLIYFTEEAMRQAIAGLTARLAPGGYLFLGPAESLRGLTRDFEVCHARETFFYRRRQAVEAGRRPATAETPWYEAIRSSAERLQTLVPAAGRPAGGYPLDLRPADLRPAGRQPPGATVVPVREAIAAPAQFVQLVGKERFAEALALLEATPLPGEQKSLLRASMLTNLGRHAEAETECRRLLAEDALNPGTHYLLGLCREQAGALEDAAQRMGTACFLDPGFAMAHLHGGLLARRQGAATAARAAFERALAALEGETDARLALFGGGFSRDGLRRLCAGEIGRLVPGPAGKAEVRA